MVLMGGSTIIVLNTDFGDDATYKEGAYNGIARVNTDGSGWYIKESKITRDASGIPMRNGTPFYSISDGKIVIDESNKVAWAGLTMGTPGTTSIQHLQMAKIAEKTGLDLVNIHNKGSHSDAKSIYYDQTINSYQRAIETPTNIDGGIIWEPQLSKIAEQGNPKGFIVLALTNDVFPGHTCCIIAGRHTFIENNLNVVTRFLAGHIRSIEYISKALEQNENGEYINTAEYEKLVNICLDHTTELSEPVIRMHWLT